MFRAGTKRLRFGASFFSETAYFFPLCFPLTAFSEFYGILRASLESLENTTLFRRAFTPFYTPSLIQVPPRAPNRKPRNHNGYGFFSYPESLWLPFCPALSNKFLTRFRCLKTVPTFTMEPIAFAASTTSRPFCPHCIRRCASWQMCK